MHIWGQTVTLWSQADWTWGEAEIASEMVNLFVGAAAQTTEIQRQIELDNLWRNDEKKRKRLIRLVCKINGKNFDESKELKDNIKVTTNDARLVIKSVLNVDVTVNI